MDKQIAEAIKARITEYKLHPTTEIDSLMEMLYDVFTENCRVDTPEIRKQYQVVTDMLTEQMERKQMSRCMSEVNFLCSEYERGGFLAGLTVGAKMMIELLDE